MERFVQLAKQMKDEKNKDIQDKVEEKKVNNVLKNKIAFLEDMTDTHRNNYFGIGITLKINLFVLFLIFLLLIKLYLSNYLMFVAAGCTMIVLILTGIMYTVIRNRKMIITRIGMISQNSIIKLYHLNNNWLNKIIPLRVEPDYKKLYMQTVAETTIVKKLEEKLINKKEVNKLAEMMETSNKITIFVRTLYNILKIVIIVVIIWWISAKAVMIKQKFQYSKVVILKTAEKFQKAKNFLRNLDDTINYQEKMKDTLIEIEKYLKRIKEMKGEIENKMKTKINDVKDKMGIAMEYVMTNGKEKFEDGKEKMGIAMEYVMTKSKEKVEEGKEKINRVVDKILDNGKEKIEKGKEKIGKTMEYVFTKMKKYKNILGKRTHSLTNELTLKSH